MSKKTDDATLEQPQPITTPAPPILTKFEMQPRSGLTHCIQEALLEKLGRYWNGDDYDYQYPAGLPEFAQQRYKVELRAYCDTIACTKEIKFGNDFAEVVQGWWSTHQQNPEAAWQIWLALHPSERNPFEIKWVDSRLKADSPGAADFLLKSQQNGEHNSLTSSSSGATTTMKA